MSHYKARLSQVLLEQYQNAAGSLYIEGGAAPRPGQYLHVYDPADSLDVAPHALFAAGLAGPQADRDGVLLDIAGPLPETWAPGIQLLARGPLGHGFNPPRSVRKLALAAIGCGPGRLLPLLAAMPAAEAAVFCDHPIGELPLSVEQQGLENLPAALAWADFMAIDISMEDVDDLANILKLKPPLPRTEVQVLVRTAMPCGGLAECGVCTLAANRGARLVCEDGPVFALSELL